MAAHFVICKYCGEKFNRDVEEFVEVGGRRYAHKSCADKVNATIPQEEKDYAELEKYIKKLFNIKTLNIKMRKQIQEFHQEYGYTYTGMLKTLYWWYEIKGHTTELAQNGIGIVPFVYTDAEKYYYTLYLAKMVNDNAPVRKPIVQEVEIPSPRVTTQTRRLFHLEDDK